VPSSARCQTTRPPTRASLFDTLGSMPAPNPTS
jgi:hypothetical protein